jgi:hypothetical protein
MDALSILLIDGKKRPGFLDPLFCQEIAARNIAALHHLCLDGGKILACLFVKKHLHNRGSAESRIWHAMTCVTTRKP